MENPFGVTSAPFLIFFANRLRLSPGPVARRGVLVSLSSIVSRDPRSPSAKRQIAQELTRNSGVSTEDEWNFGLPELCAGCQETYDDASGLPYRQLADWRIQSNGVEKELIKYKQ